MSYLEWVEAHAKKHAALMQKLKARGLSKEQIIDYFDFDNMRKKEEEFCELYAAGRKCHSMKKLNCFLCACPCFRFYNTPLTKESVTIVSECSIASKNGKALMVKNERHQDCSGCIVPHSRKYVETSYNVSWHEIMAHCLC